MSKLAVTIGGYTYEIELDLLVHGEETITAEVDGLPVEIKLPADEIPAEGIGRFIVNGRPYETHLDQDLAWIRSQWGLHLVEIQDLETAETRLPTGDGRIKAPIPGQVTQVFVSIGDIVEMGQPLLILEAMKMENEILASRPGVVQALNIQPGQTVTLNQVLAEIA